MSNIKKFGDFEIEDKSPIQIVKEFKLDDYLKNVLNDSNSNLAPYHNINHVLCMVKNVYIVGNSEGLDKKDIKLLIIAALFHDFNHSMGKHKDDKNIEIALKACDEYVEDKDLDRVKSIIEATQFPYVIEDKDLDQLQKIIRDCDMMQTFENNYIHQVIFGLAEEIGTSVKEFVDMQIKFLDNLKFYTDTAKSMNSDKLKSVKKDVKYLKKIL